MKKPKYDVEQFDEAQINDKALVEYEKEYSESGLKDKIAKYGKVIGAEILYKALQLWVVLQKDDVPTGSTKNIRWYYVKKKYKLNVNFSRTSVLKLL